MTLDWNWIRSVSRYNNVYDLARLPWFDLREGRRLVVADDSLGPIVDVHTHLAFQWVVPLKVDLNRLHDETLHYLPMERPLDLDIYANRNFDEGDLTRLRRDLGKEGFGAGGMRTTHTLPNLAREMAELSIASSVLLPIDFPAGLSRNADSYLRESTGRSDMICFGSVHPYDFDVPGKLDAQKRQGARGIKVHPPAQYVKADNPRAMRLYRLCAERDLPILIHCGPVGIETYVSRMIAQLKYYERAVAETPEAIFILGHSGALQMEQALSLAERYPNVWLEISSQSLSNIMIILERADPGRVLFGSDWPFYHQAIPLAKVLLATKDAEALRPKIFWDNAARLFGLERPPKI